MKTKCRPNTTVWHKWFAWHPVSSSETLNEAGTRFCHDVFFWEWVERKEDFGYSGSEWVYRRLSG